MRIFVQCKRLQVADCRLLGKSICHRGPVRNVQNSDAVRTPCAALLTWLGSFVRNNKRIKLFFALCLMPCALCVGTAHAYTNFDCGTNKFCVKTTELAADTTFSFSMSAYGNFTVDWGDGSAVQTINRTNTISTTYSHKYTTAGTYIIKFNGTATAYNTATDVSAIGFRNNSRVKQIEGSLGALFPTIQRIQQSNKNPGFRYAFAGCTSLVGSIPDNLFNGITGQPRAWMFANLFQDCTNLSGEIPETLFQGINGAPKVGTFSSTFKNCSSLTGEIPENLFSGISGSPQNYVFADTFYNCQNLSGQIPEGLFSGLNGAPAQWMFRDTFFNCVRLNGNIPNNLFGNIQGAANTGMFARTFKNCSNLSGYVPSSIYSGITNVNTDGMKEVFYGTNLATSCPTQQITTGWESQWSSKVACGSGCPTGYGKTDSGECQQLCSAGITEMHVNTSMFNVYANKQTEHALHVKYNNQICYVSAATDVGAATSGGTNTLHIRDINGDVYHLIN